MARKQLTLGGGLRSVALALLLLHFGLHSVSGLHCYECTSDDPGCDKDVASSSISYVKDCSSEAIGCAIYTLDYEFLFKKIYHRSCYYSFDFWTFGELNNEGYVTKRVHITYRRLMLLWGVYRGYDNRGDAAPPVVKVKYAPSTEGKLIMQVFEEVKHGELGNGIDFKKWTWPGRKESSPERVDAIECYSCEFEMRGVRIKGLDESFDSKALEVQNVPACTSKDGLKKITCKNAYGCAAFLWQENVSGQIDNYQKDYNESVFVSRAWRGCWYPGDFKCLREDNNNSSSTYERNLQSGEDKESEQGSKDCAKAYQRSFELRKGVVVWAGQRYMETSTEYNKYLQCRHEVRLGVNADTKLELVKEQQVNDGYAFIRYLFCGPESKCNKFHRSNDPSGNGRYNSKDYETMEEEKEVTTTNRTDLGDCYTEEGQDKKNQGGVISTKTGYIFTLVFAFILIGF